MEFKGEGYYWEDSMILFIVIYLLIGFILTVIQKDY